VTAYYASEIDKWATIVSDANYPDIIRLGDINDWEKWDLPKIDLIIAGSPCQGFSFAGKQLAFDDPRSALFFKFLDILNTIKAYNPDVKFMLENVRMKKEHLDVISDKLNVQPVMINSALVSAQNRVRYYWCNWDIEQPNDKGILLKDIIDDSENESIVKDTDRNKRHYRNLDQKSLTCTATMYKGAGNNGMTLIPKKCNQVGIASDIKGNESIKRIYGTDGKSPCLTTMGGGHREPKIAMDETQYRKLTPLECERLQTVPDNYTNHVSNTQRYKMLGNGWTVDVISHIFRGLNGY
jgi:DNA-cytosine methyltransferase